MGWEKLSNIVKNVYAVGGSVIIHKTDADYSEESGRLAYSDIDSYSMVCDSKYGYLFGCSISENKEYPTSIYLRLVNRKLKILMRFIFLSPMKMNGKQSMLTKI